MPLDRNILPARVTRSGLYPLGPIAMGLGPDWSGVRDNEGAEFEDIRRTRPQAKYLSLRRNMTFMRVTVTRVIKITAYSRSRLESFEASWDNIPFTHNGSHV